MKKPTSLHIVFDSSVLFEDPSLSKTDMLYLHAFAKLKLVKMHFPWFVYKERTTDIISEIIAVLDSVESKLKGLSRKGLHIIEEKRLDKIAQKIAVEKAGIASSVERVWEGYFNETNSELHKFNEEHSSIVFDHYFSGKPPYRKLKSRDDIPDAFILETLKELVITVPLHFLCNDKELAAAAADVPGINVYATFDEFFNSAVFEPVKKYYGHKGADETKVMEFMACFTDMQRSLQHQVENWKPFEAYVNYPLSNDDFISVNAIDNVKVSVNPENIKVIENELHVPLEITGEASIDFFVDRSDYFGTEERQSLSFSQWNDHVFLAEATDKIYINYTIIISADNLEDVEIDTDISPEEIEEFDFGEMRLRRRRTRFRPGDL